MATPSFACRNRLIVALLLVTGISPLSGCSYLITNFAETQSNQQIRELKLPYSNAHGFAQCLQSYGGSCPSKALDDSTSSPIISVLSTKTARPNLSLLDSDSARGVRAGESAAESAREVLESDTQLKFNALFNIARGVPKADALSDAGNSPDSKIDLTIDIQEFNKYLSDIEEVTSKGGWDALEAEGQFADTSPEDLRRRAYIAAYFRAYFRNGKFYSAKVDGSELKKAAVNKLKDTLPGLTGENGQDPYEELAKKLFVELKFDDKDQRLFGKINSDGFVTRGGQELKFPSVESELSLSSNKVSTTKIDYTAVGADLVRVLLHAIFDAHDGIPGVSNATGYSFKNGQERWKLPPNETLPDKKPIVDADQFAAIESRSQQIETAASAGVGRLVRGIGFVALNNEALAQAIETAIGVAVRKHTEKVLWCWQACQAHANPLADYAVLKSEQEITLTLGITGEPNKVLGIAKQAH